MSPVSSHLLNDFLSVRIRLGTLVIWLSLVCVPISSFVTGISLKFPTMQTPATRFCCSLLPICYFNMLNTWVFLLASVFLYHIHTVPMEARRGCLNLWGSHDSVKPCWCWKLNPGLLVEAESSCMGNMTRAWQRSQHKCSRTFLESRGKQAVATFGDHDEELPLPPLDQGCTHRKSDFTQNMDVSMWFVRNVLPSLRDGNSIEGSADNCTVIFNLWCVSLAMGRGREGEELFILAASYWTIYQDEFRFTIHYAFQLVLCKGANGFPGNLGSAACRTQPCL